MQMHQPPDRSGSIVNPSGFAQAVVGSLTERPSARSDKDRAIAVARVILRAPNIDKGSDVALLARELLRALVLRE